MPWLVCCVRIVTYGAGSTLLLEYVKGMKIDEAMAKRCQVISFPDLNELHTVTFLCA